MAFLVGGFLGLLLFFAIALVAGLVLLGARTWA